MANHQEQRTAYSSCPNCGSIEHWWEDAPQQGCNACDYWELYNNKGFLVHRSDSTGVLEEAPKIETESRARKTYPHASTGDEHA